MWSSWQKEQLRGDYISREKALKESYKINIDGEVFDVVQVETLLGIPPADVRENIRGTWEEWKGSRYQGMPFCSKCRMCFPFYAKDYNFCPNCGEDKRKPIIDEEDIPMEYFESGGK